MTAKRYQTSVDGTKFDYTYDTETGVWSWRMPRHPDFTTGQAPTPRAARDHIRELIRQAFREGYMNHR